VVDFFLYATASAVVFNKLFFPTSTHWSAPCWHSPPPRVDSSPPARGIIFGHFGDARAQEVLVVTLILMVAPPF